MHKQQLCRMAAECGLRVPKSIEFEVGQKIPKFVYPVFTKAASSFKDNWKADAHICHNEKELESALENIGDGKVLIQEYIDKKDEYILQGMSLNGGDKIFLPIQGGYYRLQPGAYGTFLHFEHYQGGDELKKNLQGIMKKANFTGIFEAEFLVDRQDRLYFLEVNFRQTAWNHTFTWMGINLTWMFSEYMLNGTADFGARIKKEPFSLMNEIPDFLTYVGGRKLSLWKWLGDVRRSDAFQYFDKKDIRPFLFHFSATFSRKIKKHLRLI